MPRKKIVQKVSSCYVSSGNPDSLIIEFSGEVAQIPSSSNTHTIGRIGRRLCVKRSRKTIERIDRMTACYRQAVYMNELRAYNNTLPDFHADSVFILIIHAHKPRRFDSHNVPKAVCDWLEKMGIIKDDTHAECLCIKAQDYPSIFRQETTVIRIVRRKRHAPKFIQWLKEFHADFG